MNRSCLYISYILLLGCSLLLLILSSCEGTISGEASGRYENNSSYSYIKTVNGKVVEEVQSNKRDNGGFEGEFNIVINGGDTASMDNNLPELHPKISCTQTLTAEQVERIKAQLLRNTLDKNRLVTAKVAINDHCLSSEHIRQLLALFTMDKYRLDLAQFAYGHATDKTNYQVTKEAFSFDQSKEELDRWINAL